MSTPRICEFVFDDDNIEKMWAHGLRWEQVDQVLYNDFIQARNRKGRVAPWLIIGRDHGGKCIAIPIAPTHDPSVWRPVTAWTCKASEEGRLERLE